MFLPMSFTVAGCSAGLTYAEICPVVSTTASCTCEISNIPCPRRASKMSSTVKRSFFTTRWSSTPPEIIIFGEPQSTRLNPREQSERYEKKTSMHTIVNIGTSPISTGRFISSIGKVAMFESIIVTTSSLG